MLSATKQSTLVSWIPARTHMPVIDAETCPEYCIVLWFTSRQQYRFFSSNRMPCNTLDILSSRGRNGIEKFFKKHVTKQRRTALKYITDSKSRH